MGGQLCLAIRYQDGNDVKEVSMERWTNDVPWRILHKDFLLGDSMLREIVAEAQPKNKWPDSKLLNRVVRSEYGCILIDMINRECYSRQAYCTPFTTTVTHVHSAYNEEVEGLWPLVEKGMIDFQQWPKIDIFATNQSFSGPVPVTVNTKEELIFKTAVEQNMLVAKLKPQFFKVDQKRGRSEHPKKKEVDAWLEAHGWTLRYGRNTR